jgi:hypothetical protein
MYLTEDEARGRVCPQFMGAILAASGGLAGSEVSPEAINKLSNGILCIASECMMFRHSGLTYKGELVTNEYYCGLVGKP